MRPEAPTKEPETPRKRGQDDAQACPNCGGGMARNRDVCETCEALLKDNLFGEVSSDGRSAPARDGGAEDDE